MDSDLSSSRWWCHEKEQILSKVKIFKRHLISWSGILFTRFKILNWTKHPYKLFIVEHIQIPNDSSFKV